MEKIKSSSEIKVNINLSLTEVEASALHALAIYGSKEFLNVFYEKLGKTYMQPHEKGLISLFDAIKNELPKHLERAKNARDIFNCVQS